MGGLGEVFSLPLFVFGPKYTARKKPTMVLMNFIFSNAKMATWISRKNKMAGRGWTDPLRCVRGLVAARLSIEHAYFTLTNNLEGFRAVWGVGQVLCSLGENQALVLTF